MAMSSRPSKTVASPSAGRASRASTSKRVSYYEQGTDDDVELEGGLEEVGDRYEGENGDEEDEEEEGLGQTSSSPRLQKYFRAMSGWDKSIVRPAEQRLADAQRDLRQVIDKGKREADAALRKQLDQNEKLVNATQLDRPRSHLGRSAAEYEAGFALVEKRAQTLAASIDELVARGIGGGDKERLVASVQALDGRPRAARRTWRKLQEGNEALRYEMHELDEEQLGTGQTMYRCFRDIAHA